MSGGERGIIPHIPVLHPYGAALRAFKIAPGDFIFRTSLCSTPMGPPSGRSKSLPAILYSAHPCAPPLRGRPTGVQNRSRRFCRTTDWISRVRTVSTRHKKGPIRALFYVWRRERDSNPRYSLHRIHTFQACAFNRSATSPLFFHFEHCPILDARLQPQTRHFLCLGAAHRWQSQRPNLFPTDLSATSPLFFNFEHCPILGARLQALTLRRQRLKRWARLNQNDDGCNPMMCFLLIVGDGYV